MEARTGTASFFNVLFAFNTLCAESIKSKIIYASEISDVQAVTISDASLTRTVRGNIRDEVSVLGKVLLYAARCTVKRGYTSPGRYESFSLTARIVAEDGTKLSVELVGPAIVAVGAEAKPLAAPPRQIEKGINRTHKLATSWAKIKTKY